MLGGLSRVRPLFFAAPRKIRAAIPETLLALRLAAAPVCLLSGCVVEQPAGTPANTPAGTPATEANAPAAPSPATTPVPEGPPAAAVAPAAEPSGKLEAYAEATARALDPRQREALAKIPEIPRKLLALRGYLRGGDVGNKWSWTEEEVARYKTTAEYRAALAEVEKVRAAFASSNPDHTLHVNTEVRTLDEQLAGWNRVESVRAAGEELLAACQSELASPSYAEPPDESSAARFSRFLRDLRTSRTPTLAVPGLSPHGQLRAFDFQVMQGGSIIADTSSGSVGSRWDAAGWSDRLKEAVLKSGARLTGPLASPREPWHYTYTP